MEQQGGAAMAPVAIRNILLATDFAETSAAALPFARAIARHYRARLHLLHVIPAASLLPVQPEPYSPPAPEFHAAARAEARRSMATICADAHLGDLDWHALIREGDVAAEIACAINEHNIDFVVLGTHGRSGLRKLLLGSVAEEIFRTVSCPVLTAGPKLVRRNQHGISVRNILCATDFSPSAQRVVPFAAQLAEDHQAHVTWLYVAPGTPDELPFRRRMVEEEARRKLNALLPYSGTGDVAVEFGAASERILAAAAGPADVIVMGVRGLGAIAAGSTRLPGGTTVKVICQATCPVLTIRG